MVVQMNALMVWAGIGLVGFGVGALKVALQSRAGGHPAEPQPTPSQGVQLAGRPSHVGEMAAR